MVEAAKFGKEEGRTCELARGEEATECFEGKGESRPLGWRWRGLR